MQHDDPTHRTPPRAEPIQPDRPGRGSDRQGQDEPGTRDGTAEGAEQRRKRSEDALDNVREGYGG